MDPKSEVTKPVSRRGLLKLGAVAGLAAGGAALGLPVSANAATGQGTGISSPGTAPANPQLPLVPVVNNAVSNMLGLPDLQAQNGVLTYVFASAYCFGSGPGSGNPFILAPINVPPGATLVAVTPFGTSTAGQTWRVKAQNLETGSFPQIAAGSSPAGSDQFVNLSMSYTVPLYTRVWLECTPSSDASNVVIGAGYFYIPSTPGFHAIAPLRVYDSRLSGGPMTGGQTRTISVATTTGGAPAVPVAASAILYNLTVTDTTTGIGFLALFPAGTS